MGNITPEALKLVHEIVDLHFQFGSSEEYDCRLELLTDHQLMQVSIYAKNSSSLVYFRGVRFDYDLSLLNLGGLKIKLEELIEEGGLQHG